MLDIEDIVSAGICSGCGLCLSIDADSPAPQLEMRKTKSGHLRPAFKHPTIEGRQARQALSAKVGRVCPGVQVPAPAALARPPPLDSDVWGAAFSLTEGHATDPAIRHKAATGGVLTAVCQHLLESGTVETICHCSANFQGDPLLDGPQESSDSATVLENSGSRYGPCAPLSRALQLLDTGKVFALVGKPCDIGAMRRLALIDPRVDKQCLYMLSIFCEGPTDLVTVRRIAKKLGVGTLSDVGRLQYRGNGCPGPTAVTTKGGVSNSMTYTETWFDKEIPWRMPWRCKTCADSIGLHADLVALDIWPNGLPTGEFEGSDYVDPGFNYITTRTEKGEGLLQAALKVSENDEFCI